jgi:hypothetical protein
MPGLFRRGPLLSLIGQADRYQSWFIRKTRQKAGF